MYPEANIPIVQISIKSSFNFQQHIDLGISLSKLRSEGVLIIGSGFITHNLSDIGESYQKPAKHTKLFTEWIYERLNILNKDTKTQILNDMININNLESSKKLLQQCHPRLEHLIPLYVSLGAAIGNENELNDLNESIESTLSAKRIYNEIVAQTLSFDSYLFN